MFSKIMKKLDNWMPLSLVMSRLEIAGGFALAVLAGLDWSQLISMSTYTADWQAFATVGGIMIARGAVYELARRFNTKDAL